MAGKRLEKAVEQWAVDYAWNTYGWDAVKMNLLGRRGEPDRLFLIHGGRPLYVEFKRLGLKPTKLQAHRISELRGWGYDVETCDNRESAKDLIDRYAALSSAAATLGAKSLSKPSRSLLPTQRMRGNLGRPRGR